jgi:hypothetical protein
MLLLVVALTGCSEEKPGDVVNYAQRVCLEIYDGVFSFNPQEAVRNPRSARVWNAKPLVECRLQMTSALLQQAL